jgi:hypothetical protein
MEKKIYSQPKTKVLSIAKYCDTDIDFTSAEAVVYGPAPEPIEQPVEPVKDLFN